LNEDLSARLLVLASGWGTGDDVPNLLACARNGEAHIAKVGRAGRRGRRGRRVGGLVGWQGTR